jgi:hypothetical protein
MSGIKDGVSNVRQHQALQLGSGSEEKVPLSL